MSRRLQPAEAEIRTLVEHWAAAVRLKNRRGILADHDADLLLFDVPPPLQQRGLDAYWRSWQAFFPWLDENGVFDVHELSITAGDDVAFCHALIRCVRGDSAPTIRLTIGLRKTHGRWTVTHEHHSEPAVNNPGLPWTTT